MKTIEIASPILEEILSKKKTFSDALKDVFQTNIELRPLRAEVAGLIGCELRHHLLFEYLLRPYENFSEAEKQLVELVLANAYFYRHLDVEETKAYLTSVIGEEKFASLKPLFDKTSQSEEYIPSDISRSSSLYLSLRYNTPEWVLKIFQHYGYGATYKTLRKFAKPAPIYMRVRTSSVSTEEAKKAIPELVETSVEDIYLYTGKTPLRKNELFREGKVFAEKPGIKKILDAHKVHEPAEILIYSGKNESYIDKEIIETYGSTIGINIATPDVDLKADVMRLIKEKGLHNVNFFSAPDPKSMEASISHLQDLVIVAPDSTNFDAIASSPDFLMQFKKEDMDGLFAQEKEVLEGASNYVQDGGKLLYLISTISKKEGHVTIAEFLRLHPEFHLESEAQMLPFEDHGTAAYYAVLTRQPLQEKATPPLGDLHSLQDRPSSSLSASND